VLTDVGVVSPRDSGGVTKELGGLAHFARASHPVLVVIAVALGAETFPGRVKFEDLLIDSRRYFLGTLIEPFQAIRKDDQLVDVDGIAIHRR
jgi:hypothetical protein